MEREKQRKEKERKEGEEEEEEEEGEGGAWCGGRGGARPGTRATGGAPGWGAAAPGRRLAGVDWPRAWVRPTPGLWNSERGREGECFRERERREREIGEREF